MERKATGHFSQDGRYFITGPDAYKHEFREGTGPYEYLMGALAGCFYSTLNDYERKCSWDYVEITPSGVKREAPPTTLENTRLEIVAKNCTDKEEFEELVKKTASSCSIYNTIACVSNMDIAVRFEDDEE